jgi:Na+/H+ antiporter NhaD/arsenite permease-like protein
MDTHLDVPIWAVLPFAGLLVALAVLPLAAPRFWHRNRNRALVAALFALPAAGYLLVLELIEGQPGVRALLHGLEEYISFILLLASLYVVSGGVVIHLRARPGPVVNGLILAAGVALANVLGTTGASMLLLRPFLRLNGRRRHTGHLPVFFIFLVGNLGGLLTPLGDPPLFLGYLRGVDFFWTLRLWPPWAVANGIVLSIFLIWDALACCREPTEALLPPADEPALVRVRGLVNLVLLAGIVVAVLLQSEALGLTLRWPWGSLALLLLLLLSLFLSPRQLRRANGFRWGPIVEVAIVFAGIFVTMVPALELLRKQGGALGLTEPWQYFWATGLLSSVLDNAPTYLAFATLAAGQMPFAELMHHAPEVLAAISCGAVFLGALTYVGNGPNFLIKALAEEAGYRPPSFLGYVVLAALVLLPTFALVVLLFFHRNG